MFGNKNEKAPNAQGGASTNVSNSFVEGAQMVGDIKTTNDIRIDGELIGKLDCGGRVIIGPQGRIEGTVVCNNAIIEGSFTGILKVKELLSIKETAKVDGDVETDKLMVQPGAIYNVTCSMGGQKLKPLLQKENVAK